MTNNIILKLDEDISQITESLKKEIENLEFEEKFRFKLENFDNYQFQLKSKGIYLFEINLNNLNIDSFLRKWEEGKPPFTPNISEKRVKVHQNNDSNEVSWLPVYIGKSNDLGKRITEHIFLPTDKTTYAMKLKGRNSLLDLEFNVSTIEFNMKNYDFIMPFY